MKRIKYILIASLLGLLNNYANAQITSYVSDFSVNNEFVASGKINLTNSSTNTIKYKFQITRSLIAGTNNWNSTDISVGIGIYKDGKYVWLNGSTNVTNSDFGQGKAFFEKEITVTIDNSKLTAGGKIYLVFENHPSNVSSSLWFKEAYSSINYGYDLPGVVTPPQPEEIDPNHLAKIQAMGFSTNGIKNFSSVHYLVEDDILINKSALNAINPIYALNNDKEHNVNIWVKSAVSANSTWDDAILLAIGAWNANPNSDVKLHLVRQYGTLDTPPPYDIIIDSDRGFLSANQAKAVEYPVGNGKTGGFIMANLDYNFTSTTQATNNMIHAIGHSLSLKHKTNVNSIMANNNLSNYSQAFPSSEDNSVISSLYPLNSSSVVISYISGIANLSHGSEQSYDMSYYVPGVTYSWSATGGNGAAPDFSWASQVRLPEVFFDPGSYQLQCTVSVGKYTTPVTAVKNITAQ